MALKTPAPTLAELATASLDYLVQNPEQLAEFMIQTGLDPQSLRKAIGTAGFAHGLIDHVVQNEPLLLAIAAETGVKPETVMAVWAKHSGPRD